ncbi:DUF2157 domain-containing protein [Nanoarchaeota archaeon]
MVDKNQINQWLKEGTITKTQADKMLADTTQYKKEQSSNKLIVAISTIGAILLGIGAILFIASNWQDMPNIVKVLILVGSTFGAYYIGYSFKYQKKNLPTVGASLIFLGALLFGATIFLIAQMYNINANNHVLLLIWLIGVLPLVYAFHSVPIAGLSSLIFYLWIGFFVFRNIRFDNAMGDFFALPVLYLVSGVLLFAIGAIHYMSNNLKQVARTYRIAGIKIVMLALFLLTFRLFSGFYNDFNIRKGLEISGQLSVGFVIFSIIAIVFCVANLFFNPPKSETNKIENLISLGLLGFALIFFFFPAASSNIYVLLFNLILAGIIFTLIYVGYNKEDMALVNVGMFWLSALIVVRYFDFFWDLLPRSLFFMVGGLILVLGGIALEKKRRQLKTQFGRKNE